MKLRFLSILAFLCACSAPPTEIAQQRYIVVGMPSTDIGAQIINVGGIPQRDLAEIHQCTAMLTLEAAAALQAQPGILIVEKDRIVSLKKPTKCPTFPNCGNGGDDDPPPPEEVVPWGIAKTGADTVHDMFTGLGIKVVINDTGIDSDHEDLFVEDGINFSSAKGGKPSVWKDDHGHGTHVAGTVAALSNTIDVVGMAPNAELYACKSLDRNGSGYLSDVISCIDWAVSIGADVMNMSLGTSLPSEALEIACDEARVAGVFIAVSAGNSGDGDPSTDDVGYPAQYASTFAVGATDINDDPTYFTSDGPAVDVAAPGRHIVDAT